MTREQILLKQKKTGNYLERIAREYEPKSKLDSYPAIIQALTYLSTVPNLISIATGFAFAYYLLSGITGPLKHIAWAVAIILLIALELGKRYAAQVSAKQAAQSQAFYGAGIALGVLIALSMTISFKGGQQIVVENSVPPTLSTPAEIQEARADLTAINESIKRQEGTTWKGVITVDANRNLKSLYRQKEAIAANLAGMLQTFNAEQSEVNEKHQTNTVNFSIVFGSIALGMDLILILIFLAIAKRKSDLYILATAGVRPNTGQTPGKTEKAPQNSVNNANNEVDEILKGAMQNFKQNSAVYAKRNTATSQAKAKYFEDAAGALANLREQYGFA